MGDTILIATLGIVWLFIFTAFRNLRTEMLLTSLFAGFLMPGLSLATSPIFPVKEVIFIFFLAGLSATIFHALIGISYDKYKISQSNDTWFLSFLGFIISFSWLTVGIIAILEMSTISAMLISGLLVSLYMWIKKKSLFIDSLLSATLIGTLVLLAGIVSYTIPGENSAFSFIESTKSLFGIPLELIALSIILGLFIGPLYEFSRKLPLKHGK